jgi:hypothetical protein
MLRAPVKQALDYHAFDDTRALFGVPNFWNVASNLPFLVVGLLGIEELSDCPRGALSASMPPNSFFRRRDLRRSRLSLLSSYAGQRLPDLGSPAHDDGVHVLCRDHHRGAHRSPDRCPVAATACAARRGVGRLLAADRRLRPYIVVQFLPLLVIPLVLLLFPSSFSSVALVWAMLGSYALSKALELGDDFTFAFGGLMSGHALKHAVAALSMYLFVLAVRTRAATTV